jgi:hypothetical protein
MVNSGGVPNTMFYLEFASVREPYRTFDGFDLLKKTSLKDNPTLYDKEREISM